MNLMVNIKRFRGYFRKAFGRETAIGKAALAAAGFIKAHIPRVDSKVHFGFFVLVLAAAAYFRFWAAPISAGVDVPQFWAFAKVFQTHGIDFYRYADATGEIFPVKGWAFVYPPIWLLILGVALAATPMSLVTPTIVDPAWRVAMKTPIIAADLAIGCLLYWAIPGGKLKKLFFASLWLFHPTSWYNSAVFGQFDAIAAALLLGAVILLERGKDRPAFFVAALAVMTKQHVLIPVFLMIAVCIRTLGWRRLLGDIAIFAGVVIVISIPFLLTGNFVDYGRSLLFPGQVPDYQTPLMYAFSGGGSLLTYFHLYFNWDTIGFFPWFIPLLIIGIATAFIFSYRKNTSPSQAALVGFLVFICFNYRVNYQYLVIYIPLALWVAAASRFKLEKAFGIVMALLPAVWMWLFEVGFWFFLFLPQDIKDLPILEHIGWMHLGMPDYSYVILAMVLMGVFLAYIVLVFTKWRQPKMLEPVEINKSYHDFRKG